MKICLSEFLSGLDFLKARKSGEFVGTREDNPAMILEEQVAAWTRLTSLEDLQECFRVFEEKVCVTDFPARYTPQFWLAHAALTTIYNVMIGYLETHVDAELKKETGKLLFDLWVHLLACGPGSTHLEMMDIVLKYPHYPLWKYMQTLHGEDLRLLVSSLRTDFVYKEEVSADHYATLMETHIDKVFKTILSPGQIEEARRELLDLYSFYMYRMNHVPPHIGPRLSHLCFLICQKYELENPYMGRDDWVIMRNHLKVIKDVITDSSFTVASEAQYRAPLTLEKIFQAAVKDKMLNIMFKDFMSLLLTICNHSNSKKCKRLFLAYQTGLFEQLDFKYGFDETPTWLFTQCLDTLVLLSKTFKMETHMDELIISTQNLALIKFTQFYRTAVSAASWHDLMVNYIVSGRTLLVKEARNLLNSPVLKEYGVLNWKTYEVQGRLFIDIITDAPGQFMQADEEGNVSDTIQAIARFIDNFLAQIRDLEIEGRVRQNVHKCLLKCMEKEPPLKSPISLACIQSGIPDFTDVNFIKDGLFSVDTLLKDARCPGNSETLSQVVLHLLQESLHLYKSKGYVPVDVNSLLMTICISCLSADDTDQDDTGHVTTSCDMWNTLYETVVLEFVEMHLDKGSIRSISSLVPQVILAIQESIQRLRGSPVRCVDFLSMLGTKCFQLVSDHLTELLELFLDWQCYGLSDFHVKAFHQDPGPYIAMFQDIFSKTLSMEHEDKHHGMIILEAISEDNSQLFLSTHICQLLGIYPLETKVTQCHILNVVHNVVRRSPGQVAGYFTVLIDDSKFTTDSLQQRSSILQYLCQYNDDHLQKTLDYLMKHADSRSESVSLVAMEILIPLIRDKPGHIHRQKDHLQKTLDYLMKHADSRSESVSLVAMEILIPLIRDKPGHIHRQKVRFKNIWKSSKNERIKQLCVQVLPEIKATVKKPAQTTAVKETGKKVVPPINSNTKFPSKMQARPQTSDRKPTPPVAMTTRSDSSSSMVKHNPKTSHAEVLNTSITLSKEGKSTVSNTTQESETDTKLSRTEAVIPDSKGAGDKVLSVTQGVDIYKKQGNEPHNVLTDQNAKTEKEIKREQNEAISLEQTDETSVSTDKVGKSRLEHVKSEGNMPVNDEPEKDNLSALYLDSGRKSEDSKEQADLTKIKESVESHEEDVVDVLRSQVTNVEPDVCLCSSVKTKHLMERFGVKLRNAGYNNIVKDVDAESDDNTFTGAKVVMVCLDNIQESTDIKLINEITSLLDKDIPLIVLKFQNVPLSEKLHKAVMTDRSYIRLYSKPGEDKIVGTDWPKYKFCEVLMQLSYLGVTPDEQLITQEFQSLWGRTGQISLGQKHIADQSVLPDIFISYHWGKLKQIEPLYKRLLRENLSCWFGAYQMGGTESLYHKIQHGLQSCRIVLACVTNNYHLSKACERDVRTAKKLDRIIIPLLIGDCTWPVAGKVGNILTDCKPMKLTVGDEGIVDTRTDSMSKLVTCLQKYHTERKGADFIDGDNKSAEIPQDTETDQFEEKSEMNSGFRYADIRVHGQRAKRTVKKTSSAYDLGSRSVGSRNMTRRHSNIDDLKIKRRDLPDGVLVDEDGYTLRSTRSKSCIIL